MLLLDLPPAINNDKKFVYEATLPLNTNRIWVESEQFYDKLSQHPVAIFSSR